MYDCFHGGEYLNPPSFSSSFGLVDSGWSEPIVSIVLVGAEILGDRGENVRGVLPSSELMAQLYT